MKIPQTDRLAAIVPPELVSVLGTLLIHQLAGGDPDKYETAEREILEACESLRIAPMSVAGAIMFTAPTCDAIIEFVKARRAGGMN